MRDQRDQPAVGGLGRRRSGAQPHTDQPDAAITSVTKRVEVIIPPAYVTIPWFWAAITAEAAAKVAVSVTVPDSGVSSVVGGGDPSPVDVGGPAGGRSWSLVCALGVV